MPRAKKPISRKNYVHKIVFFIIPKIHIHILLSDFHLIFIRYSSDFYQLQGVSYWNVFNEFKVHKYMSLVMLISKNTFHYETPYTTDLKNYINRLYLPKPELRMAASLPELRTAASTSTSLPSSQSMLDFPQYFWWLAKFPLELKQNYYYVQELQAYLIIVNWIPDSI